MPVTHRSSHTIHSQSQSSLLSLPTELILHILTPNPIPLSQSHLDSSQKEKNKSRKTRRNESETSEEEEQPQRLGEELSPYLDWGSQGGGSERDSETSAGLDFTPPSPARNEPVEPSSSSTTATATATTTITEVETNETTERFNKSSPSPGPNTGNTPLSSSTSFWDTLVFPPSPIFNDAEGDNNNNDHNEDDDDNDDDSDLNEGEEGEETRNHWNENKLKCVSRSSEPLSVGLDPTSLSRFSRTCKLAWRFIYSSNEVESLSSSSLTLEDMNNNNNNNVNNDGGVERKGKNKSGENEDDGGIIFRNLFLNWFDDPIPFLEMRRRLMEGCEKVQRLEGDDDEGDVEEDKEEEEEGESESESEHEMEMDTDTNMDMEEEGNNNNTKDGVKEDLSMTGVDVESGLKSTKKDSDRENIDDDDDDEVREESSGKVQLVTKEGKDDYGVDRSYEGKKKREENLEGLGVGGRRKAKGKGKSIDKGKGKQRVYRDEDIFGKGMGERDGIVDGNGHGERENKSQSNDSDYYRNGNEDRYWDRDWNWREELKKRVGLIKWFRMREDDEEGVKLFSFTSVLETLLSLVQTARPLALASDYGSLSVPATSSAILPTDSKNFRFLQALFRIRPAIPAFLFAEYPEGFEDPRGVLAKERQQRLQIMLGPSRDYHHQFLFLRKFENSSPKAKQRTSLPHRRRSLPSNPLLSDSLARRPISISSNIPRPPKWLRSKLHSMLGPCRPAFYEPLSNDVLAEVTPEYFSHTQRAAEEWMDVHEMEALPLRMRGSRRSRVSFPFRGEAREYAYRLTNYPEPRYWKEVRKARDAFTEFDFQQTKLRSDEGPAGSSYMDIFEALSSTPLAALLRPARSLPYPYDALPNHRYSPILPCGCPNWPTLDALHTTMVFNCLQTQREWEEDFWVSDEWKAETGRKTWNLNLPIGDEGFWGRRAEGDYPLLSPPEGDTMFSGDQKGKERVKDEEDEPWNKPYDWAGVEGVWLGSYAFVDHRDFHAYNTPDSGVGLGSYVEAVGEIMSLRLRLVERPSYMLPVGTSLDIGPGSSSSAPTPRGSSTAKHHYGADGLWQHYHPHYPTLYFEGDRLSTNVDPSIDSQSSGRTNVSVHGCVRLTRPNHSHHAKRARKSKQFEGEEEHVHDDVPVIYWTFLVGYGGQDRWRIECIQPSLKSPMVWGNWSSAEEGDYLDEEFEALGPLGPCVYWKPI